jgi:hypothetical protein
MALMKFIYLKPWWVQKLTTCNTCCYHYHQELKELLGGFNNIRVVRKGIHEACNCNWSDACVVVPNATNLLLTRCNATHKTYGGLINLWTSLVYTQFIRPTAVLPTFGHLLSIHSPFIPSGIVDVAFLENANNVGYTNLPCVPESWFLM